MNGFSDPRTLGPSNPRTLGPIRVTRTLVTDIRPKARPIRTLFLLHFLSSLFYESLFITIKSSLFTGQGRRPKAIMTKLHGIYFFVLSFLMVTLCPSLVAQESAEQMASYYYQNQEYSKAIELYEPLYNRSQSVFYYRMLYQCYLRSGQLREAESLVERRIKKQANELALYVDLGSVQLQRDNKKKAEKTFATAIEKIGRDSKQVSDLALAFENAGMLNYAIMTYLRARETMNNKILYVMELATLYEKDGQYEKMMQEYFDFLDSSPGSKESVQISLQRALAQASSNTLAEGLRKALTSRIRQNPDNQTYLDMMIWFSLQQKDFEFALTQAKAVDARFPDLEGKNKNANPVLRVAQIAASNEVYDVAEQAYRHLIAKGKEYPLYFDCRVGLLDVEYSRLNLDHAISSEEYILLENDYQEALDELGKNQGTIPLMRNFSHLLAYNSSANEESTARLQKAADLLYDIIEMPRVPANIANEVKLELGDLLLFSGEVWDASLLYSQVEKANKNDVVGAMAKFKNAKLSYYNGDFLWAKSQLDVLRASTSKLVANDAMELSLVISDNMEDDSTFEMLSYYASADLMIYRGQLDSAWTLLESIVQQNLSHSLFDEVLMQKARIRMRQGMYQEADSLLQFVVDHYGDDILADDALFMMAELNEQQLDNPEKARQCYERIILDYPASLYVDRARKRYRK